MRFAFIQAHAAQHHVTTMCRVLKVSKAGYYAWVTRGPSARAAEDGQLAEEIKVIHQTSRRTYGSPRVHEELKAQGQRHGEKRVARIMRLEGLRAKQSRRFRRTTDSSRSPRLARPLACGSATSPTSRRARAGCTSRSSSISRRGA
jgi:putative transposase